MSRAGLAFYTLKTVTEELVQRNGMNNCDSSPFLSTSDVLRQELKNAFPSEAEIVCFTVLFCLVCPNELNKSPNVICLCIICF